MKIDSKGKATFISRRAHFAIAISSAFVVLALFLSHGARSIAFAQQKQSGTVSPKATGGASSSSSVASSQAATAASTIPKVTITQTSSPLQLAQAALTAQGGDNFRHLKSLVLIGSVDLFSPNSTQSLAGKFVLVTASGDRYHLELQSPLFNFRQTFDGQQGSSSMRGIDLPPLSKFGLNVLAKFDQPGYIVSALPNDKKRRAFRIADAEGNATDFYVDAQTGRVVSYLIPYNGYRFGVEHKTLKEVDGVLVPYSFVQRLELPQGAFFAEYKVKEVKINQPVSDDLFKLQAQ